MDWSPQPSGRSGRRQLLYFEQLQRRHDPVLSGPFPTAGDSGADEYAFGLRGRGCEQLPSNDVPGKFSRLSVSVRAAASTRHDHEHAAKSAIALSAL